MNEITVVTATAGFEYECPVSQYEGFEELVSDLGEEKITAIINADRKQAITQGTKAEVRKAIEEHGADSPEVQEAVASAQEAARSYGYGKGPSGGRSGPTNKQKQEFGAKIAEHFAEHGSYPSQEEQEAIAEELGIRLN